MRAHQRPTLDQNQALASLGDCCDLSSAGLEGHEGLYILP